MVDQNSDELIGVYDALLFLTLGENKNCVERGINLSCFSDASLFSKKRLSNSMTIVDSPPSI